MARFSHTQFRIRNPEFAITFFQNVRVTWMMVVSADLLGFVITIHSVFSTKYTNVMPFACIN